MQLESVDCYIDSFKTGGLTSKQNSFLSSYAKCSIIRSFHKNRNTYKIDTFKIAPLVDIDKLGESPQRMKTIFYIIFIYI
jgi:hypothetical protein